MDDLAWAAGLYEGEGSFVAAKTSDRWGATRWYPRLTLSMTDEDVVRRFAAVMGVGQVDGPVARPNRKRIWLFRITVSADALGAVERLRPWLGGRRLAQIEQVLAQCARSDRRGPADQSGRVFSEESKAKMRAAWVRRKARHPHNDEFQSAMRARRG